MDQKKRKTTSQAIREKFPVEPAVIHNGVQKPLGVAFAPSHKGIVVADSANDRLRFFSQHNGSLLYEFGSRGTKNGQFTGPVGTCIQPATNNLIVTDAYRLQAFSVACSPGSLWPSFTHLFSVGSAEQRGNAPYQFNDPKGICCTARGDIIVADSDNHRMQIFDCKGRHVRAFGSEGHQYDRFCQPVGVCVQEEANRMIITDCSNQRLSVWSVDGCKPIRTVQLKGFPVGICDYPHAHRIVASLLYPSDDIKVFDTKTKIGWNVIQEFGSKGEQPGRFYSPYGVCIDDRGMLVVADCFNHRVQVF